MSFLCLNPKPESLLGILRLFMQVQSLTNMNQVSDLSGMSFPYVPALCVGLMIAILSQYPLVKFIFDCAELTKACAKQTGPCDRGYEIIRRNFNR